MWPVEFIRKMTRYIVIGVSSLFQRYKLESNMTTGIDLSSSASNNLIEKRIFQNILSKTYNKKNNLEKLPNENIIIKVRLPITNKHPKLRIMNATIPKNMKADELKRLLANELKKDKENWQLIGRANGELSYALKKDSELTKFQDDSKIRLYFYPKILDE